MTRNIVSMRDDGRMTFPATARKALHIKGETDFTYEVTEGGLFLRPIINIPREDAWAYTREHRATVEQSRRSPSYTDVSSEDLEALITADNPLALLEDMKARWTRHEHE